MNPKSCPTCHAPIPENAPGGLCPACVLRDAEEGPAPGHGMPPIEEIAAAFPQWEILGLIGRGGMGFVYKVRQPALDRTVALKILDPALGRFPLPSQRAEVGKRIDEIVLRTLEKERELRQQSATEVRTEVEGARSLLVNLSFRKPGGLKRN